MAAAMTRALTEVLGAANPVMVLLWLTAALALAFLLVFGWQRLFRR